MAFEGTKKAEDLQLEGVKVELDIVDNSIKLVTLTDRKGKVIRFRSEWSSIHPEIVAAPKMRAAFRLTGRSFGFEVDELWDSPSSADTRARNLRKVDATSKLSWKEEQVPEESELRSEVFDVENIPF